MEMSVNTKNAQGCFISLTVQKPENIKFKIMFNRGKGQSSVEQVNVCIYA